MAVFHLLNVRAGSEETIAGGSPPSSANSRIKQPVTTSTLAAESTREPTVSPQNAQPTTTDTRMATAQPTPEPTKTPLVTASSTASQQPTPEPTETPQVTPSSTSTPQSSAHFSNAYFCLEPCRDDGGNHRDIFASGIHRIYVRWQYEDVPISARYERLWYNRDQLWAHYECTWPGPHTGIDAITLTEPDGLHHGEWRMVIRIDGQILLDQSITLTGSHDYWYPAGYFDSCYGKK